LETDNGLALSMYRGDLSTACIMEYFAKVKKAFPALPASFYDILAERIKENGFSDQRLKDAVNHVTDTFTYSMPTVAHFISFDKRVKLFTRSDMIKIMDKSDTVWKEYKPIKIDGIKEIYFASVLDIKKYNLKQVPS